MKLRTIKILALSYCLYSSVLLQGQDVIHIDRNESVRFLEKIYSSTGIWKTGNDSLREAISHLIYDDDTRFPVLNNEGVPIVGTDGKVIKAPKLQFNELLGVSFVFRF